MAEAAGGANAPLRATQRRRGEAPASRKPVAASEVYVGLADQPMLLLMHM